MVFIKVKCWKEAKRLYTYVMISMFIQWATNISSEWLSNAYLLILESACYATERRNQGVQIPWTSAMYLGFSLSKHSQRFVILRSSTFHFLSPTPISVNATLDGWNSGQGPLHRPSTRLQGRFFVILFNFSTASESHLPALLHKTLCSWLPRGHTPSSPPNFSFPSPFASSISSVQPLNTGLSSLFTHTVSLGDVILFYCYKDQLTHLPHTSAQLQVHVSSCEYGLST